MVDCIRGRLQCQIDLLRKRFLQSSGLPFAGVLSTETIAAAVCGDPDSADEPVYTPAVTLWMFLSQVLDGRQPCRQAVARLLSWRTLQGQAACSPRTGGYCKARQRLPEEGLRQLTRHTGVRLQQQACGTWLWKGRPVKLADGTLVSLPDTPDNQREYPQPDGHQPGLGFPVIRLVVLIGLATGAVLEAALGRYCGKGTGELSLFRQIWHALKPGDVLLADRLFCSYFEVALLAGRGVDVVVPRHQSRRSDFRTGTRLGPRDHVIRWSKPRTRPEWLDPETYCRLPATLAVRELQVRVEQRGFRVQTLIVITTLLDPDKASRHELADLYRQRWHAELDLRSIKQALGMERLSCKSAAMVRRELWVHLLAYNLIRAVMAQAAAQSGTLPRQLSFSGTVQTVCAFEFSLATASPSDQHRLAHRLLAAVATHRVADRPGRIEPRSVKRRHRKYPVLNEPRLHARNRLLQLT